MLHKFGQLLLKNLRQLFCPLLTIPLCDRQYLSGYGLWILMPYIDLLNKTVDHCLVLDVLYRDFTSDLDKVSKSSQYLNWICKVFSQFFIWIYILFSLLIKSICSLSTKHLLLVLLRTKRERRALYKLFRFCLISVVIILISTIIIITWKYVPWTILVKCIL